jgi:5-methylcytosine-specific restriction endonuclease McrBC regulatory subunit McrC
MTTAHNHNLGLQLAKLKGKNIDLMQIEPLLEYAISLLEVEIRNLRASLSKIAEVSLRHEYLARIDSLQVVKSKFSLSELVQQIGKLDNQEEQKLNVY